MTDSLELTVDQARTLQRLSNRTYPISVEERAVLDLLAGFVRSQQPDADQVEVW